MNRAFASYLSIAIMLLLAFTAAPASAESSCKLQGSWIGETGGQIAFIATYHGQSSSSGTSDLEFPSFALAGITSVRGVWEKNGSDNFVYSIVGYMYDQSGAVTSIAKNSGTKVMSKDCNTIEVHSTTKYYAPNDYMFQNPLATVIEPVEHEYRIMVDPQ